MKYSKQLLTLQEPQNPTIADMLFKTTFLAENWGSGVGRIMDACREANLPEP